MLLERLISKPRASLLEIGQKEIQRPDKASSLLLKSSTMRGRSLKDRLKGSAGSFGPTKLSSWVLSRATREKGKAKSLWMVTISSLKDFGSTVTQNSITNLN